MCCQHGKLKESELYLKWQITYSSLSSKLDYLEAACDSPDITRHFLYFIVILLQGKCVLSNAKEMSCKGKTRKGCTTTITTTPSTAARKKRKQETRWRNKFVTHRLRVNSNEDKKEQVAKWSSHTSRELSAY